MFELSQGAVIAAEIVNPLPVPAWMYGAGFLAAFTVLAMITYSYRNVANKHRSRDDAHSGGHH